MHAGLKATVGLRAGPGTVGFAVALLGFPAAVHAQENGRLTLRGELGLGSTPSPYQSSNDHPGAAGLSAGFAARGAYALAGPVAAQVSLGVMALEGSIHPVGMPLATLGVRLDVPLGVATALGLDLNAGVGAPAGDVRGVLDVGAGVDFTVTRMISLAPTVRYGQVIVPAHGGSDGRTWTLGVTVSFHGLLPRTGPTVADADADGVPDDQDRCPTVPTTPEGDRNHDGCPDGPEDSTGTVPQWEGARMAPGRSARAGPGGGTGHGAPALEGTPGDRDADGVPDTLDRCPDQPETVNGYQDTDGCPEDVLPLAELDGDQVRLTEQLTFASDSDRIVRLASFQTLDAVATVLRLHPEITRIEVQGHTDTSGNPAANRELSQRRADSVRTYLLAHGTDAPRVVTRGLGSSVPLADNRSPYGRALNRRVEFHLLDGVRFPPAAPLPPHPAPYQRLPRERHHSHGSHHGDRDGTEPGVHRGPHPHPGHHRGAGG